ncbi:MAG TPA: hypothetical protein ENJ50_08640 [Planctomycetaceae bacterium]|nr:hypothetical protein [Planctomycetaceae bacterium]
MPASITSNEYHQKETRVRPVQCRRVIRVADSKRRLSESRWRLRTYDRYLRTSEAIANYHAGFPTTGKR